MFYYAFLNDQDIVTGIYEFPTKITDPKCILIPSNDQTLIGKKYNRETGLFEDLFFYAVLGNKDIVTEVISSATAITDPNKIKLSTKNTALVGKWYNRQTGEFLDPPIHILAEHSTQQINLVNQDKWLQTELNEIRAELVNLGRNSSGEYKCKFNITDNQETTTAWTVGGKRYNFNFNTGLAGYFPKKIRIVANSKGAAGDEFVADIYIVKNSNGTIKYAYLDKNYFGVTVNAAGTNPIRISENYLDPSNSQVVQMGCSSSGSKYDEGGSSFFQGFGIKNENVSIGGFSYNENTLSFTVVITKSIVGYYTRMNLTGYVY